MKGMYIEYQGVKIPVTDENHVRRLPRGEHFNGLFKLFDVPIERDQSWELKYSPLDPTTLTFGPGRYMAMLETAPCSIEVLVQFLKMKEQYK